ncbi:TonB-dependent receptor family protein [Lutimonas saemankumensis]|uniref:outer membrane beta-barrel family protein n=1 Tax=Lutimonas saemankumensis TaxID=483016 RepID=UPI001CD5E311|nr:outer membrane beta-barrel family protein [Lutimonas saemankumensis]MCA0932495.1 TonB-dependent receptor family protein [Lutimonas saemankumensis]
MRKSRSVCFLLGLLLVSFSLKVYGQNRSIKGQVFDSGTKEPLPFVHTLLFAADTTNAIKGSTTNLEGSFHFENLVEDSYTIKLLFIGYSSIKKKIEFSSEETINLGIIYMNESVQSLQDIEVVIERNTIVQKSNKTILNINEGLSQSTSVSELLENIPSVNVDDEGIAIQGQKPVLLIDGIESTRDEFNSLSPQIISSIEVQTNASAKYAGSKIINVKLKSKGVKQKSLKLSTLGGNYDFYNLQLHGNYRKNKWNFGAGGFIQNQNFYREQELVRTFDLKEQVLLQEKLDSTNVKRKKIFANAAYKLNKKNVLMLKGFLVNNQQEPDIFLKNQYISNPPRENYSTNDNDFNQNISNVVAIWRRKSDRIGNFEWTNQYQNLSSVRTNNSNTFDLSENNLWGNKVRTDESLNFVLSRVDYDRDLSEVFHLEAGASFKLTDNSMESLVEKFSQSTGDWEIDPKRSYTYDYLENKFASYLSVTFNRKKVAVSLGLRLENITWVSSIKEIDSSYTTHNLIPSPVLDINYKVNQNQNMSLGFSRRIIAPKYLYLNPHAIYSNPDIIRSGNPFLDIPSIWNAELVHNLNSGILNNKFSVFIRKEENKIARIISESEADAVLLSKPENIDETNSYGLDLTQKYKINKNFSINTYLLAYHLEMKDDLLDPRASNKGISGSAKIGLAYKTSYKLRFNINYNYQGRRYIPNAEISDYSFVDVRVNKSFLKNKFSISLKAKDIFMGRKSIYQGYSNATYNNFHRSYNSRSVILGAVYNI